MNTAADDHGGRKETGMSTKRIDIYSTEPQTYKRETPKADEKTAAQKDEDARKAEQVIKRMRAIEPAQFDDI